MRVVTETDIRIPGSASINRRASVVFPAPDGDDRIYRSPRRATGPTALPSLRVDVSLNVLHLLAELIDNALKTKARARNIDGIGLRAKGVGFPVEFLREKIEFAPDGTCFL